MNNQKELPSFEIIAEASNGDVDAINAVLRYYKGYIISLSIRKIFDKDGQCYTFLDEELQHRLETKLITKIIGFRIY